MNFIPQTSPSLTVMWVAIVAAVISAAITIGNGVRSNRRVATLRGAITVTVSSFLFGVSIVIAVSAGVHNPSTQKPIFQDQVQARYGLELTSRQIKELEYPSSRPDGGLQTYGTTTVETKVERDLYRRQKVQLISEDGKLKLTHYKEDRGFEELPRKDTDR